MALPNYVSQAVPFGEINFAGGLNTLGGPLSLRNNESSNLQNIDFDRSGSILKRNGYIALNTTAISGSPDIEALHWFEYNSSGTLTRKLLTVSGTKLFKMDSLDGTWDDITGGLTITAGNWADSETFLDEAIFTNNVDVPFSVNTSLTAAAITVPTGLTKAKFVTQYNNYCFLANVEVSGTRHNSRIYWSNLKTIGTWTDSDYIEIALNDGQEITGMKVLGDRLVVYKSRSIYNVIFTGSSGIPFILPGGGKSNSTVGCASGASIQEVQNGHVFLSFDGFYFYDGNNSFKISDKITTTILGTNTALFSEARSLVQKNKNRYWCALPSSGQTENDRVFIWDFFHNAWSLYVGMAPAAMTTVYVSGTEERPYFGDYSGFVYRADTGADDYPLNVQTAINGIYFTNWKPFDDLVHQKSVPHINIYFQNANTVLTFGYSFNFSGDAGGLASADSNDFSTTINLATSIDVYGTGVYGTAKYAGAGGDSIRQDLTGRGRTVRFMVSNNRKGETFQIDGLGILAQLETNV